ncbi:biotin/lipoyl-binding protein [Bosea sp. 2RAB26]
MPIGLSTKAEEGAVSSVPVVAADARRADVPIFLTGLGTVVAFNSVDLTSRVDGQIQKFGFDEGKDVRAGDVLVEIDPAPYQAALAQAEAAKLKDEALVANARGGTRGEGHEFGSATGYCPRPGRTIGGKHKVGSGRDRCGENSARLLQDSIPDRR